MLSPAANSPLDIRDSKVILPSSEHESEQRVSRSRRLTVQDNSAASDILELLSEMEASVSSDQHVSDESERAGRAAANLMTNIVLSADFRALEDKFSDFVQESALALYKTVLLCVSALSLGLLPGKGLGNTWPPFQAQVFGPEISTYFTDPYTFLHFEDGIIAFLLWGSAEQLPFSPSPEFKTFWDDIGGLILGLFAGYVFELFENSDYIINRLKRDHGTSQFYEGDSKINVFGDILALGIGYSMSKVCTMHGLWWFPILWLIVSEIGSALTFHDNLLLASIQTVWPQQWIKDYQQQLVPAHLSGLMRVGYWDNKVRDTPEQFVDRMQKTRPDILYSPYLPLLSHEDLLVSRSYWSKVSNTMYKYRRL